MPNGRVWHAGSDEVVCASVHKGFIGEDDSAGYLWAGSVFSAYSENVRDVQCTHNKALREGTGSSDK